MRLQRDILSALKKALKPQGTLPLVRIFFKSSTYYEKAFIDQCIEEIKVKSILDPEFSALERLAVHALCDSAYINIDKTKG